MYCLTHMHMLRCNAIDNSLCEDCGKEMITFNAPPVDKFCKNCSEENNKCQFCGEKVLSKGEIKG